MDDRRRNHAMRRLVDTVLSELASGTTDTRAAAIQMQANGVPIGVAVRLLRRRRA